MRKVAALLTGGPAAGAVIYLEPNGDGAFPGVIQIPSLKMRPRLGEPPPIKFETHDYVATYSSGMSAAGLFCTYATKEPAPFDEERTLEWLVAFTVPETVGELLRHETVRREVEELLAEIGNPAPRWRGEVRRPEAPR